MNILFLSLFFLTNPFKIDYPETKILSEEQYTEVQDKLHALDITPLLDSLYPTTPDKGLRKKQDFAGRISRGIQQIFVDTENKKKTKSKALENQQRRRILYCKLCFL